MAEGLFAVRGAFYLLKDASNPQAQPLDFREGMNALAAATGVVPTRKFRQAATNVLLNVAQQVKETIVQEVTAGIKPDPEDPPLAPFTVEKKGHDNWLYETGKFVRGLTPTVLEGTKATRGYAGVGLVPTGRSDRGITYWHVMQVLTLGAVIRQGDKVIVVPPRRLFPEGLERITEEQATKLIQEFFGESFRAAVHLLSYEPWTQYTKDRVLDRILHLSAAGTPGTRAG